MYRKIMLKMVVIMNCPKLISSLTNIPLDVHSSWYTMGIIRKTLMINPIVKATMWPAESQQYRKYPTLWTVKMKDGWRWISVLNGQKSLASYQINSMYKKEFAIFRHLQQAMSRNIARNIMLTHRYFKIGLTSSTSSTLYS